MTYIIFSWLIKVHREAGIKGLCKKKAEKGRAPAFTFLKAYYRGRSIKTADTFFIYSLVEILKLFS